LQQALLEMDESNILVSALKPFFFFEEQFPLKCTCKVKSISSMPKEDLLIDTTFNPCQFSLDSTFKTFKIDL
jgi:hypothetical protein